MKIAILYPPITRNNEFPLLTQNRQFKFSNSLQVRIYPVVMSYLATLLKNNGHQVLYLDGINSRMSPALFEASVLKFKPDFAVMETKAPMVRAHWEYIGLLKEKLEETNFILIGDHVSFYPEESIRNSKADYVIRGSDYDLIITDLIEHLSTKKGSMPAGVYTREGNTGPEKLYDLNQLPVIDRELTRWDLYGEAYLYHPVAYIMTGRGCGGSNSNKNFTSNKETTEKYGTRMPGLCTFCIWQYAYYRCSARLMSPKKVVDEIENLIVRYKVKEIFDDNESGAVWNIGWLKDFYEEMKRRDLLNKVILSSNARADSLTDETCQMLKKLNYRLLKIGVESGNDKTLQRLKKDETVEEIREGIKRAKQYGLIAMLTTMVGYPWEDEEDTARTFRFTKEIMLYKTHFGDSLQSSIIVPYPGTPLYKEALKNKWFIMDPEDYDKFDMAHQILKSSIDSAKWCKKLWRIHLHPVFLLRSFLTLRKWQDIKLAFRGLISLLGHLRDYEK
ncbi:MAG: radical SAM protein [bacterium]|nr:radical SAM protein [bacterium]